MKHPCVITITLIAALLIPSALASPSTGHLIVTPQGRIVTHPSPFRILSPEGLCRLDINPIPGPSDIPLNRVTMRVENGPARTWDGLRGNGFLITDTGVLVAIERPDTDAIPARLTIFLPDGRAHSVERIGLHSPAFSSDQRELLMLHDSGTDVIDLDALTLRKLPVYSMAAAGCGGFVAGLDGSNGIRLELIDRSGRCLSRHLDAVPRDMAFSETDRVLWIMGADRILRIGLTGDSMTSIPASPGAEFTDLFAVDGDLVVGSRCRRDGVSRGTIGIYRGTQCVSWIHGDVEPIDHGDGAGRDDEIPWPFTPDEQHVVGNSYGAYQGFDPYNPYMHPGIDILVPHGTPVYAVRDGVVKAILTTSGDLHWRVAVADEDTSGTSDGYLYAHLVEGSITVQVGDAVTTGQHLGNIVEWVTDFHHLHFARIQAAGSTWTGSWKNTRNPHLLIRNRTESEPPSFLEARPGSLFAFCNNQSNTYQAPDALTGDVDIIVSAFDRVLTHYESAVQELWYSIYQEGNPAAPVVDNRLAVRFDMELDTYQSGSVSSFLVDLLYKQDTTCQTWFDYDARVFYYILTNSNGDDVYDASDLTEAWHTAELPDGRYVIEVTAVDTNANISTATMTVTTANGNPPVQTPTPTPSFDLGVRIDMPTFVRPGGDFQVRGYLDNPGDPIGNVLVFFVLRVHDGYWFWPSWIECPAQPCAEADWDPRPVGTGSTEIIVVPWFEWPDTGSQSVQGLHMYGAMVSEDGSGILGAMADVEWSYGP